MIQKKSDQCDQGMRATVNLVFFLPPSVRLISLHLMTRNFTFEIWVWCEKWNKRCGSDWKNWKCLFFSFLTYLIILLMITLIPKHSSHRIVIFPIHKLLITSHSLLYVLLTDQSNYNYFHFFFFLSMNVQNAFVLPPEFFNSPNMLISINYNFNLFASQVRKTLIYLSFNIILKKNN